MWLRFLADHSYTPPEERRMSVAYKQGCAYSVKQAWAEAMIARGVATRIPTPRRKAAA